MAKEIQATATLPGLPDGYGPDVHFGPQEDRPHVWFHQNSGEWIESNRGASYTYFHAYKREPVKHVRWVNLYLNKRTAVSYDKREVADKSAMSDRIACVRIEFEEGQFDE